MDAVDFRAWTDPRLKALLAALLTGLLVAPSDGVASTEMGALVARLDAIRAEYDVPAFAIVIVDRRGILLADTRGSADLASGRRVDGQTRFRIGSITKTFTAMAVLRARRSGDLALHDPVTKWLPEPPYRNPYAPGSPLRLEQLLEHTAGLQDWLPEAVGVGQ